MDSGPSQLKISDLPTDVLYCIFIQCPVQDVIRLRQCCRRLSDMSQNRSVWIRLLRTLVHQTRIYAPSYPLAEMSTSEIEFCATAFIRFRIRSRKEFERPERPHSMGSVFPYQPEVPPRSVFDLQAPSPQNINPEDMIIHLDAFRCCKLVFGGRFLLTIQGSLLQLWDLGVKKGLNQRQSGPALSAPTASTDLAISVARDSLVLINYFRVDGELLRFMVIEEGGLPTRSRACLYEICPIAPTPQFREMGCYDFDHWAAFRDYQHPYVVLYDDEVAPEFMAVWNVTMDTYVKFHVKDVSHASIDSNSLFMFHDQLQSVKIYCLDELFTNHKVPSEAFRGSDPSLAQPIMVLSWAEEITGLQRSSPPALIHRSSWLSSDGDNPASFDLLCHYINGEITVIHKAILPKDSFSSLSPDGEPFKSSASCDHTAHVGPTTSHVQHYDNVELGFHDEPYAAILPEEERLFWWENCMSSDTIRIHFSHIPYPTESPGEGQKATQYVESEGSFGGVLYRAAMNQDLYWGNYSFCPGSARLCVLEKYKIKVMDY